MEEVPLQTDFVHMGPQMFQNEVNGMNKKSKENRENLEVRFTTYCLLRRALGRVFGHLSLVLFPSPEL
ncbi:hypothetical protein HN51_060184 [Arachis hypogaea]